MGPRRSLNPEGQSVDEGLDFRDAPAIFIIWALVGMPRGHVHGCNAATDMGIVRKKVIVNIRIPHMQ